MDFAAVEPFASHREVDDEFEALDKDIQDLYMEVLEFVRNSESSDTTRVRAIFESNKEKMDVNVLLPCVYGESLLYQAVQHENVAMVKLLLELGANPRTENMMDGETPLEFAEGYDGDNTRGQKLEQIYQLLLHHLVPKVCGKCNTSQGKLQLCSRCHRIRYCSKDCQKQDWKDHKPNCKKEEKPDYVQQAGELMEESLRELLYAIDEDPEEVQKIRGRDDILSTVFLQQLDAKMEYARQNETPDNLFFMAERNKFKMDARKLQERVLTEGQRALVKEAFAILETSEEEELCYESAKGLVARIKEIYSQPGMDVNIPSTEGSLLLVDAVQNYVLGDKDADAQVELVKFLLEKGADPNKEDCVGGTAQDHLDYEIEFDELTKQQKEMIRLLKEAGALIKFINDDGRAVGERGDTEGRHEEERKKRAAASASET